MPQKCKWRYSVSVHEKQLPGELNKCILKRIGIWGKCGHLKQTDMVLKKINQKYQLNIIKAERKKPLNLD